MSESENKIVDEIYSQALLGIHPSKTPVMLIKYGPPGSGKGKMECLEKFYKHAEILGFEAHNFVDINVDDFVRKLDVNEEIKLDSQKYWKFRPDANIIADALLETCFYNHYHVVFETTGSRLDEKWLVEALVRPANENEFKIVVAYPLVPVPELIKRSAERALRIGRNPDPGQITTDATNAARNLKILYKYVDLIVLFDNRTEIPCEFEIIECKKKVCAEDLEWKSHQSKKEHTSYENAIHEAFDLDISLHGGNADHRTARNGYYCKMCRKCRRCVNCGRKMKKPR